ncbi:hypothetical protein [Actinopolymorpha pittospori]|uniref:Uncharacterized protein n=1 Tax=Actinopolymorpha pittospori TaxID=648752 RepID=A0A927N3L3_9ACTN|nr:hypothetical protein [Actinopolymorpha pittospori]MBE1607960.1 hypothetical protein [Actinopolymorpha pittospori]
MTTARARQIPPLYAGLVDDAALFPPAGEPLAAAVPAHFAHRGDWYADLLGPFLCPDALLPELATALDDQPGDDPLALGLVVAGGAGAIEPALVWTGRVERIRLVGLEIALRDEPQLGRNVERVARALDSADLPDDVLVTVEVPRVPGWETALDAAAETGFRAKLRTGGEVTEAFPAEREVARFILACLDRELSFKCTAGLHHAVRTTDRPTDRPVGRPDGVPALERHGFLNVALATRAGLDGADEDALIEILADRDTNAISAAVRALDDRAAASTRRWFTSFGSCSVSEPLEDLLRLEILQD